MRQVPSKCPKCSEPNIHNLDYCAVCGTKFKEQKVQQPPKEKKGGISKEKKLGAKRVKKRKELTELFQKKKITVEQYSSGLRKLGYSTNADKAAAFKKYIREQIKTFEELELDPNAVEGGSYYDPNESQTDLPRDENGNIIVDFTASPSHVSGMKRPTEDGVVVDHGSMAGGGTGPRFGSSLFGERRSDQEARVKRDAVAKPKMFQKPEKTRSSPRKVRALADWDDEEEEEEEELEMSIDEDDHEEVEEEIEGESGWWDEEGWSLEWTDDDEDEFELDLDEEEDEEESGWVLEFEDDDEEDEYVIEFDEEESSDILVEFEDEEEFQVDDDNSDIEDEEEDDDDDWAPSKKKRRRNR